MLSHIVLISVFYQTFLMHDLVKIDNMNDYKMCFPVKEFKFPDKDSESKDEIEELSSNKELEAGHHKESSSDSSSFYDSNH